MYDEVLQAVIDIAELTGVQIFTGSLPPDNGIAMTATGGSETTMLDIGTQERIMLLCNGKNRDQKTVISQLEAIHKRLTRTKGFPNGGLPSTEGWQIYSIETTASPRLLGHEPNGQWVYGSSLVVKVNMKGI